MRKSKQIIATAVMAALLLSGCAQENKGASEAGNNTQQTPSVSSTAQIADSSAQMIEDGNSGLTTLAETAADYNGCSLLYPNFEELSVGVLYKDDDNKYCLFDANGNVRYVSDGGVSIASGFYDGMCLTSAGTMVGEDGTDATPAWLPENERIIRYAKDEAGVLLWTIKREDGIDGTKIALTARKMDGSVCFQCDTTQPEFSELNPSDLYDEIVSSGYNVNSNGISTPFIYCGGTLYRVRGDRGYVFINIANGKLCYISEYNACLIQMENGAMIQTAPSLRVRDEEFNALTEWKDIKSRRDGTPVLSEGLIYLDARRDSGNFEEYQSGFYDIYLNRVIDLSQYNIQPVTQDEPRFINGYAALQMLNPDGVAFWGVIKKDGTWSVEPQTGTIKSVYPTEGGLLVTVSQDDESYKTIDQDGWEFTDLENLTLSGYNGYWRGAYEVYNGKLYTTVNGKIVGISSDGNVEFLS